MTANGYPLVSVIVPAYNADKSIETCIKSICEQTYDNIEIIVVDDGSVDSTGDILRDLGFLDGADFVEESIRGYSGKKKYIKTLNRGVAAARNTGISAASGEFCFFIDADDYIRRDAIEVLYAAYERTAAPLIVGGFQKVNLDGSILQKCSILDRDVLLKKSDIMLYVIKYLEAPNRHPLFVTSWGRLIHLSLIKDDNIVFDEKMKTMEDVEFNFRILRKIDSICYVADHLYNYRVYNIAASATTKELLNRSGMLSFVPALSAAKIFLSENCYDGKWIEEKIDNASVSYAIVHLIRLAFQWNIENTKMIYCLTSNVVDFIGKTGSIDYYCPNKGDSKVVSFFFRSKLVLLMMLFCKYKSWVRYGNK